MLIDRLRSKDLGQQSFSTMSLILGIETSCDETAFALVHPDGRVLVNQVASQIDLHAQFGGVVPEVASRRHIEAALPMLKSSLAEAGAEWNDVGAIAVTQGPGLIGCLLMGVETAKALAWRYDKPLIAVHHLAAHLHAPFLLPEKAGATHLLIENGKEKKAIPIEPPDGAEWGDVIVAQPELPAMGLIVSGGHTSLVLVHSPICIEPIASTRDDAVGEAYDKVARAMGLGYPGGPVIDRLATEGDPTRFLFTPPMLRRDEKDFSFSGLKSAVARLVESIQAEKGPELDPQTVRDLCASFQATIIDVLLTKSLRAAREHNVRDLLIVGGVASNRGLRRAARERAAQNLRIWFPHFSLCTDNAAMIAGLARHLNPLDAEEALELNPEASLPF